MAAEVITRMYNVTSKQVLTYVSTTQGLETRIRGEREHNKLFSSPSMTATQRNKIKNTTARKYGNKLCNGRCVTISKTCHETRGLFSYPYTSGKYVLLNKDGRANLLRLGKGMHSLVLITEEHLLRYTQSNWKVHT
jgi:hypothetical protein